MLHQRPLAIIFRRAQELTLISSAWIRDYLLRNRWSVTTSADGSATIFSNMDALSRPIEVMLPERDEDVNAGHVRRALDAMRIVHGIDDIDFLAAYTTPTQIDEMLDAEVPRETLPGVAARARLWLRDGQTADAVAAATSFALTILSLCARRETQIEERSSRDTATAP